MRRLFNMGVMGLVSVIGVAGADLRLEALTGGGGTPGQLQVSLTSPTENVTGLQFDLEYDATRFEVEVVPGRSAELADKVIRTATPETNRMRVLVFGMNQTVITNGVVAVIRATSIGSDGTKVRNPVRIVSMAGTDREGKTVQLASRDRSEPVSPDAAK